MQDPGAGLEDDRGQEASALEAAPIEAVRLDVGGGDQRHAPCEELPEQEHRVGDVADLKLVEADDPGVRRQSAGHPHQGVPVPAERLQLAVHVLHERMEVHAPLRGEGQRIEERVHDPGLAPADAAPQVDARDRLRPPGREQPAQPTGARRARRHALQPLVELLERAGRVRLGRVVVQPSALDLACVARERTLPRGAAAGMDRFRGRRRPVRRSRGLRVCSP